jgi:TPR repeat protein
MRGRRASLALSMSRVWDPQDFLLAKTFYEVAVAQGDSGAEVLLGGMCERGAGVPQDYREAARHYELAADRGDPFGEALLGALYEQGLGVPQDYLAAAQLNLRSGHRRIVDFVLRAWPAL